MGGPSTGLYGIIFSAQGPAHVEELSSETQVERPLNSGSYSNNEARKSFSGSSEQKPDEEVTLTEGEQNFVDLMSLLSRAEENQRRGPDFGL